MESQKVNLEVAKGTPNAPDVVRRKYLTQLASYTKRSAILYTTRWTVPPIIAPAEFLSITEEDTQGFMEVIHNLPREGLDIVLHSPGGSAEATEGLVLFIRSIFKDVRVIVPHLAMSAATMLACSANRIVMGNHSYLGPIDPQMPFGESLVPVQAILDEFDLAERVPESRSSRSVGPYPPSVRPRPTSPIQGGNQAFQEACVVLAQKLHVRGAQV